MELPTEAVAKKCYVKKVFLEILKNSQKTPVPESFLLKRDCGTGVFL